MRDAPIVPDSSRVAISGKGPPVGSSRCLQVTISTAKHRTGLVLGSGATILGGLITSLLLTTPCGRLRALTRLGGLDARRLTLGLLIGLTSRTR